jgi:hypothetical protein
MNCKKTARPRRQKEGNRRKVQQHDAFNSSQYTARGEFDGWAVPIHMKYVAAAGLANAPVLG